MDGEQAPNRLIINLGNLRDFLTKCLMCVVAVWNLCFRYCQESGENEPSENYQKDKFSQERGQYLEEFCHQRTLRERGFKLLQLTYRFFHRHSEQDAENRQDTRESEENNQPVQNRPGVIHDMGLRLRIRKGEQASESTPPWSDVMVDHSICDPEADRLSQGCNTPAASSTDPAVSPTSNSSRALPLLDENDGERAILGTSEMPSPNTGPTETTIPLTPINKSATSALAVLDQNSPSQLFKPPATHPTSDSCSSFSASMHVPTSNTSPHLDSHVNSASSATECEGAHFENPPSQTTEPIDNSGPSAFVLHSKDKKTSDTPPPLPLTALKEEAGAEGITARAKSHPWTNPDTKDAHLKSDDAVKKVSAQEDPTDAWKASPARGRTFTQESPAVTAPAEVLTLKTKDSVEPNLKPGGPDRQSKPAFSRLQTSESNRSSSSALTAWTSDARETDKDIHDPTSSSHNGPNDTSTQPPLSCAETDLSSSAAYEAASSQVGLSYEPPEEDNVNSKPETFPSDTVD